MQHALAPRPGNRRHLTSVVMDRSVNAVSTLCYKCDHMLKHHKGNGCNVIMRAGKFRGLDRGIVGTEFCTCPLLPAAAAAPTQKQARVAWLRRSAFLVLTSIFALLVLAVMCSVCARAGTRTRLRVLANEVPLGSHTAARLRSSYRSTPSHARATQRVLLVCRRRRAAVRRFLPCDRAKPNGKAARSSTRCRPACNNAA